MSVTACLVVRNEASQMDDVLSNIEPAVDSIVVIDGESDDGTRDIAREYTDRVYVREPQGYMEADANFALSKAPTEWVFIIDADERMSTPLRGHLDRLVSLGEDRGIGMFLIPRFPKVNGRVIARSGVGSPRLFKKSEVTWEDRIHSKPRWEGGTPVCVPDKYHLLHYPNEYHKPVSYQLERKTRYIRAEAQKPAVKRKPHIRKVMEGVGVFPIELLRRLLVEGFAMEGWWGLHRSVWKAEYKMATNLLSAGAVPYKLLSHLFTLDTCIWYNASGCRDNAQETEHRER